MCLRKLKKIYPPLHGIWVQFGLKKKRKSDETGKNVLVSSATSVPEGIC